MIRKLKNLSSTHHHFRLPNGGQETVSFFGHNCTVYDCTCCTFKLFRYISQDPTDCYIFIQSLFTEICENSQSKRDHQIFKEWRRLWTELYLFQVWVSFLRLQHSIFSKIAHYFANSLDSQGSNSEWWLTKTQHVFRISTRRPSKLLNLRSSRTKNVVCWKTISAEWETCWEFESGFCGERTCDTRKNLSLHVIMRLQWWDGSTASSIKSVVTEDFNFFVANLTHSLLEILPKNAFWS